MIRKAMLSLEGLNIGFFYILKDKAYNILLVTRNDAKVNRCMRYIYKQEELGL